jgi:hypothetical protein
MDISTSLFLILIRIRNRIIAHIDIRLIYHDSIILIPSSFVLTHFNSLVQIESVLIKYISDDFFELQ